MDKLDRMLRIAQSRVPSIEETQMREMMKSATTDELLELINESTTNERFHAVVYEMVDRCGKGGFWNGTDQAKDTYTDRNTPSVNQSHEYGG